MTLIILLGIAFSSSWLSLLNKKDISSDVTIIQESDPAEITVTDQNFVLSVGFVGINILAETGRYFDVDFTKEVRVNGSSKLSETINMVPCEK